MKFFFPIHLDAGNRGCEAIAKSTALILNNEKSNLIGLCRDVELDKRLGVDEFIQLQETPRWSLFMKIWRKIYSKIEKDPCRIKEYDYSHYFLPFLQQTTKDDIVLSTGGDMMCYGNNEVLYTSDYAHARGIKTILWGCSMGESNLTKEKERTLRNFDLIYARESLSYEFFKNLGLKNVVCFPDPAFVLQPEEVELPEVFIKHEVVGINISNFVVGDFTLDTSFGQQVKSLIEYILKETNLHVLLIPHVTWKGQDDRIVAKNIKLLFPKFERISILDIDNLTYCKIRYIISKCRYFVGARTHAVISAYSTCVPTLALGYSIKSRGIAKDLGLSEKLVVNSKNELQTNEVLTSFKYLCSKEQEIKSHLESLMNEYCQKPYQICSIIPLS